MEKVLVLLGVLLVIEAGHGLTRLRDGDLIVPNDLVKKFPV